MMMMMMMVMIIFFFFFKLSGKFKSVKPFQIYLFHSCIVFIKEQDVVLW